VDGSVPKRPVVSSPKFGRWLQLQRGDRSLAQIAQRIRPHVEGIGLKVNPSLIYKFEGGRVPSWPMLAAFARVYGVPIDELLRQLVAAIEFPGASDLLRHGRTGQRTQRASHLQEDPTISNTFRPMFESLKQVAEGLILANEGVKRLADAVLNASQAHEDLRDTVARLESLVIQQGRDLHAMKTQLDNLGGAR
jgi:transcriptional regulator with XRE-family HTH domain